VTPTPAARPLLEGIRVADLTQALSGPTLTRYLVELGADVVKVEIPTHGDITRGSPTVRDGRSGYFVSVNRGKRSLCVDLKDARGLQVVADLVDAADVMVENFSPGTIGRLGLGWDVVSARNPRLVMCSISGFGQDGPRAHLPGYDGVAQAYAGITSLNGDAGGHPIVAGAAVGDVMTGVNGVAAVLGALYGRERTGRGQHVAVSLVDAYLQAHDASLQSWSVSGGAIVQTRNGRFHPLACAYGIFAARDGFLFICAAADRHWRDLCDAMGRPEWAAPDHPWGNRQLREAAREEVNPLVEAWIGSLPSRDDALARLQRHRVPVGPVQTIDEVANDPAFRATGSVKVTTDPVLGEVVVPGFPLHFSDAPVGGDAVAPFLGEHNREVVVGLAGRDLSEYEALVAAGVLHAEPPPRASGR
jgi:crotonobetainyl-CoA:carnitine CoA-transferase CaiB-like acyl-CoA transferase